MRDYAPLRATRSRAFSTWYKQFVLIYGGRSSKERSTSCQDLHGVCQLCGPCGHVNFVLITHQNVYDSLATETFFERK